MKDGYLKRGGPQTSDVYSFTEYITRHDDILTVVQVVDDPIYLDEPYVLSITSTYDPMAGPNMETCSGSSTGQNGGGDRHWVPHFLPGQNSAIGEFLREDNWIPLEPTRGGVKTLYPEYRAAVSGLKVDAARVDAMTVPSARSANDIAKRIAEQSPKDGQVHVLPVQGNIYMLVADGTNITASIGQDGIAVVNTGAAQMSDKILAALDQLAETVGARIVAEQLFWRVLSGHVGLVESVFQHRDLVAASGQDDALRDQHECRAGACRRQLEACRLGQSDSIGRLRVRRGHYRAGAESDHRLARQRARPDGQVHAAGARRRVAERHVSRRASTNSRNT